VATNEVDHKKQIEFVKPNMPVQEVPSVKVIPGGSLEMKLNLNFPEGIHLTDEAPSQWMLNIKGNMSKLP